MVPICPQQKVWTTWNLNMWSLSDIVEVVSSVMVRTSFSSSNLWEIQSSYLEHQSWSPDNELWFSSHKLYIILLKFIGEENQSSLSGLQLWCSRYELWISQRLLLLKDVLTITLLTTSTMSDKLHIFKFYVVHTYCCRLMGTIFGFQENI